jgi:flagellar biosynthetic protein FliQ
MNDENSLLALAEQTIWVAALIAGPVLIAALAIGLAVGIVQAATSINEQTLTFVPKLAIVAGVMVVMGGAMLGLLSDFTREILAQIATVTA